MATAAPTRRAGRREGHAAGVGGDERAVVGVDVDRRRPRPGRGRGGDDGRADGVDRDLGGGGDWTPRREPPRRHRRPTDADRDDGGRGTRPSRRRWRRGPGRAAHRAARRRGPHERVAVTALVMTFRATGRRCRRHATPALGRRVLA